MRKPLNLSVPWGKIRKVHQIAEYSIVEFTWKHSIDPTESLCFSCYVNDENCQQSFSTMDEALAFCIAYKHDGINTRASTYFIRAIRADHEKE